MLLGVNIDHVATLRQARGTQYPDPASAARLALQSGADSITVHLREDRRHIQDADVAAVAGIADLRLNLEMAATPEMIAIATGLKPAGCCLVPEKRTELTTEGGLNVIAQQAALTQACGALQAAGIRVSLFIDPDRTQLDAAKLTGAEVVEIHTGTYADAATAAQQAVELLRVQDAAIYAAAIGFKVHAGHGLHYENVSAIAAIEELLELNIGHSIVAQSVFDGFGIAVSRMKELMLEARSA
jgi:pyridoxine 5-phosphate synthase